MTTPKESVPVAVVIPCFRCKETIERALDSIELQTVLPAEIILIDDASGDGTVKKLLEVAQTSEGRIKVLELTKNSGPGSARNLGWDSSNSEYIAFLDSDDSWHPQKLELQYRWMKAHPEVALTGHQSKQLGGELRTFESFTSLKSRSVGAKALLVSNLFPTRSVMVRKDLSFRFFPGKRYSEDYLLWLRIVLSGYSAHVFGAVLAFSYKADYGGGGLSANLWALEKGELDTFRRLKQEGLISSRTHFCVMVVSLCKFLRRVVIHIAS